MLTYHPVARRVLDAFDVVPNLVYKEFRDLPPNHLRVRVGVSNRLFANQVHHLRQAVKRWMYWRVFSADELIRPLIVGVAALAMALVTDGLVMLVAHH